MSLFILSCENKHELACLMATAPGANKSVRPAFSLPPKHLIEVIGKKVNIGVGAYTSASLNVVGCEG